jgi:hypothetical protein
MSDAIREALEALENAVYGPLLDEVNRDEGGIRKRPDAKYIYGQVEAALQALQSGEPEGEGESLIIRNLEMMTKRLCAALNKASPSNTLAIEAMEYLRRSNILSGESALRDNTTPQPVVPEEHVVLKLKDALMLQINIHDQLKGGNLGMNGNRLASSGQALGKAIIKARHLLSAGKETNRG